MRHYFKLILVGLYLVLSSSTPGADPSSKTPGKRIKEITIVITDSGLGGLDVMGDIAEKFSESGHYKKVNLIFINALAVTQQSTDQGRLSVIHATRCRKSQQVSIAVLL